MTMSEIMEMPKNELYWEKTKLEDKCYKAQRKFERVKLAKAKEDTKEIIYDLINAITLIENRMYNLNM